MSGSSAGTQLLQIGEFAERLGVSVRTLRHYEKTDLLVPSERDVNGYRLYDVGQLDRAAQVRDLIASGLPTRVVRALIGSLTDADGIFPEHVDAASLDAVESEWERMCRCVACMEARRDALRGYLDALSGSQPTHP